MGREASSYHAILYISPSVVAWRERERERERESTCINAKGGTLRDNAGEKEGKSGRGRSRKSSFVMIQSGILSLLKSFVNKISIIDIVDISKSMTFYYRPLCGVFI